VERNCLRSGGYGSLDPGEYVSNKVRPARWGKHFTAPSVSGFLGQELVVTFPDCPMQLAPSARKVGLLTVEETQLAIELIDGICGKQLSIEAVDRCFVGERMMREAADGFSPTSHCNIVREHPKEDTVFSRQSHWLWLPPCKGGNRLRLASSGRRGDEHNGRESKSNSHGVSRLPDSRSIEKPSAANSEAPPRAKLQIPCGLSEVVAPL
jgi:hypothetical protein